MLFSPLLLGKPRPIPNSGTKPLVKHFPGKTTGSWAPPGAKRGFGGIMGGHWLAGLAPGPFASPAKQGPLERTFTKIREFVFLKESPPRG